MNIELSPAVEALLKQKGKEADAQRVVNDLIAIYLNEGIIRGSQIAGRVVADKAFRKTAASISDVYDEVTHDYEGIEVTGRTPFQSIFIPSEKLHDLLVDNVDVIVLKSPRRTGIREIETNLQFYPPPEDKEEMM
jgi:hypothetical protein